MADVPLVNRTTVTGPKDYTLPNAQEVLLKAVRAEIDGTGAAGAFLPALQLISDAGDVMWTAIDPNLSVAAGGTASVSWFPGVSKGGLPTPNTSGVWKSYTPVWSESGGVQPNIGNGTLTGLYFQIGKFVVAQINQVCGTTTTYGNNANVYQWSLPVTAANASISFGMSGNSFDVTFADVFTWGFQSSTTTMAAFGFRSGGATAQFLNSAQPVTWQNTDKIVVSCMFEAA